MFGPFNDPRVAAAIGQVFGQASERVRERRERSAEREAVGNRGRREDSDTDDLIDEFETAVASEVDRLGRDLLGTGVRLEVEFYPTNFPVSEENKYGADLGVRLHVEGPSFNVTKAVLFQNKRMFGTESDASFNQLRGDGEDQARKMLRITPASFFLLFNGLPIRTAGEWIKPPASWWPYYEEFAPFPYPWPGIWRWAELNEPAFGLWNTGIMVLPASRVYAESRVAENREETFTTDARHWIRASLPLGLFMVDMLGSCFVGDVRDDIVQLVTPPKARDLTNTGVPDFDPTMLPVRRLMHLTVRGGQ
jgi:hypothetical protein